MTRSSLNRTLRRLYVFLAVLLAVSLIAKFKEYGIDISQQEADCILVQVRKKALEVKRALFDKELVQLYKNYCELK